MCRAIVLIVGAVLATSWLPREALACDCPRTPVCSSLWTADVVFVALAAHVARPTPGTEMARISVEEWFRGERVGKEVTIGSYGVGGSCDRDFEQGRRYIIYANHRPDGSWRVDLCSATLTVDRAAQDLKYVRDAMARPGPGAVSGAPLSTWTPPSVYKPDRRLRERALFSRRARVDLLPLLIREANTDFRPFPPGNTRSRRISRQILFRCHRSGSSSGRARAFSMCSGRRNDDGCPSRLRRG